MAEAPFSPVCTWASWVSCVVSCLSSVLRTGSDWFDATKAPGALWCVVLHDEADGT